MFHFWHRWSKWADVGSGPIGERTRLPDGTATEWVNVGTALVQQRECDDCGRKQRRLVTVKLP